MTGAVRGAVPHHHAKAHALALALVLLALVLVVLGLGVGSTGLQGVWPLLQTLWAAAPGTESAQAAMAGQIVWEIRLPRTLGAWSAGALLGLAGAVAQGLFRNPLADCTRLTFDQQRLL